MADDKKKEVKAMTIPVNEPVLQKKEPGLAVPDLNAGEDPTREKTPSEAAYEESMKPKELKEKEAKKAEKDAGK